MNLKTSLISTISAGLILSACATTGPMASSGLGDRPINARIYADVLSASYAGYINDADARARYTSRAFAVMHEDIAEGRKAMLAALNVDDLPATRAIATEVHTLQPEDSISRAILGASALAKGDFIKATEFLQSQGTLAGLEDVNALVRGWAEFGNGQTEQALASFDSMSGGKYFELIGNLQKAKLLGLSGNKTESEKYFAEVDDINLASVESTLSKARIALKDQDIEAATTILEAFIDANNGVPSGPVRNMLNAVQAGDIVYRPLTAAQQASRAITEPAFGYYGVQKQYDAAEIFLRIALLLDPKNDKAALFLGSVLEDNDREDDALELFQSLDAQSDYAVSARLSEASVYFRQNENVKAVAVLKTANDTEPTVSTLASLGRGYLIIEDYENALPVYEQLIEQKGIDALKEDPEPRYLRGVSLERLGRWEEAVEDFEFVLKQRPEDSETLNYLGYTWVDKGVNLTRAFEMIRKAVKLEPDSGAIIDSLGWAHYKLGQYQQARLKLEEAVVRSPESATIVDHLGDVYAKLGRSKEARFQWQRAIELDPTSEEEKTIKAKLKNGLPADNAKK